MPLLSTAANLADLALRQVNRLVTPECRQIAYVKTRQFAAARPLLFSFIVTQAVFAAMPLAFFIAFIFMVLVCASIFSILLSIFWTGIALFFVVPVLAICISVALFSWTFGLVAFNVTRWLLAVAKAVLKMKADRIPQGHRLATSTRLSASSSNSSPAPPQYKMAGGRDARKPAPTHPAPGSGVDSLEP